MALIDRRDAVSVGVDDPPLAYSRRKMWVTRRAYWLDRDALDRVGDVFEVGLGNEVAEVTHGHLPVVRDGW
jgi:hypothetical protein